LLEFTLFKTPDLVASSLIFSLIFSFNLISSLFSTLFTNTDLGLEFLHKSKIIHRDLKTDNIFVSYNNASDLSCCAIGDLDVAKKLLDGAKAKTVFFDLNISFKENYYLFL
jgi:serine/threonine protein kinase